MKKRVLIWGLFSVLLLMLILPLISGATSVNAETNRCLEAGGICKTVCSEDEREILDFSLDCNDEVIAKPVSAIDILIKKPNPTLPIQKKCCVAIECENSATKDYECPDKSKVYWCTCYNNEWDCIKSPESQCAMNRNEKNYSKYSKEEAFLISDSNWRNIFGLVPITTWTSSESYAVSSVVEYPTLIYHYENGLHYKNLAFEKPINVSSYFNEEKGPKRAVDNDPETFWQSDSNNIEQWLQVDLQQIYDIKRIEMKIDNYNSSFLVNIKGSYDGQNYFDISELNVNELKWYYLNFSDIQTRYIKIVFPEGANRFIYEMRVYNDLDISDFSFDADSIIHFLQLYKPLKLTIINSIPQELKDLLIAEPPIGAGLTEEQIQFISPNNYMDYWKYYNKIVYVENNYELSLLASTYASLLNAPLIIDSGSVNTSLFIGKNIIVVGDLECPPEVLSCEHYRNAIELQKKYVELTNTDKMILINPNDRNFYLDSKLQPEKSEFEIYQTFGKHSLIAPILASAKHELIILDNISESPTNNDCTWGTDDDIVNSNVEKTEKNINNIVEKLFINPKINIEYLTIMASPKAIPDSVFSSCDLNMQFRNEKDAYYSAEPNLIARKTPSIAIDNNDRLNIVWVESPTADTNDGNKVIKYRKMDRNGNILINDKNVSLSSADNTNPIIKSDSNGSLHVVWFGGNYRRISALGIMGDIQTNLAGSQFYFDSNNDIHTLIEKDNIAGNWHYRKLDNYGNILIEFPVIVAGPKLVLDNEDNVYFYWTNKISTIKNLVYMKYDNSGNQLIPPTILMPDITSSNLFIDSQNDVEAFSSKDADMFYKKVDSQGNVIIEKINIFTTQNEISYLNSIQDSTERIHVFFSDGSFYHGKLSGTNIVDISNITSGSGESIVEITADSENKIHVLWNDKYSLYENNHWNHFVSDDKHKKYYDIAIDSQNNVNILSQINQLNGPQIFYERFDDVHEVIKQFLHKFWNMKPGRIYSLTTADVSSYAAESIFYDKLMNKIYAQNSLFYSGFSIGRECMGDSCAYLAKYIRDTADNSSYKAYCSSHTSAVECDHIGGPIPEQYFKKKNYITYCDHGAVDGWRDFTTPDIPWLDLSYVDTDACLTNNFWQGNEVVFGANMIRRGAISYKGSVGLTLFISLVEARSLMFLTEESKNTKSLGEMNEEMYMISGIDIENLYRNDYILLGDPTIVPWLKKIEWNTLIFDQMREFPYKYEKI